MSFEKFLWAVLKSEILLAGNRKYVAENRLYEGFNRKGSGDFD